MMGLTEDRTLEYATPQKRWPLWVRVSLAGAVLGGGFLAIVHIWATALCMVSCDAVLAYSEENYGGLLTYLQVTHIGTPPGVSTTYTFHWGHFGICLAISLPIVVGTAWGAWRLLRSRSILV